MPPRVKKGSTPSLRPAAIPATVLQCVPSMRLGWGLRRAAAIAHRARCVLFALASRWGCRTTSRLTGGRCSSTRRAAGCPMLGEPGVTYEAQMGPVYYDARRGRCAADARRPTRPRRRTSCAWSASRCMPVLVLLTAPDRPAAEPAAGRRHGRRRPGRHDAAAQRHRRVDPERLPHASSSSRVALVFGMRLLRNREARWSAHLAFGCVDRAGGPDQGRRPGAGPGAASWATSSARAEWRRRLTWVAAAGWGPDRDVRLVVRAERAGLRRSHRRAGHGPDGGRLPAAALDGSGRRRGVVRQRRLVRLHPRGVLPEPAAESRRPAGRRDRRWRR